jgi:mono/diheme cytochrome c family protein
MKNKTAGCQTWFRGGVHAALLMVIVHSTGCSPIADSPNQQRLARGQQLYETSCAACHQVSGWGEEGVAPPLVGSQWVTGSPERLIRIALHGVRGPIEVRGQTYRLEMEFPQFGFDDVEIAEILTYVRQAWGNDAAEVSSDTVRQVRSETAERRDSWTAGELLAIDRKADTGDDVENEVAWGDLRGTVRYIGKPPPRRIIPTTGRSRPPVIDDRLIVDQNNGGLRNVVTWLLKPTDGKLPIHDDDQKTRKNPVVVRMTPRGFSPHVFCLRTGQPLHVVNDEEAHNVKVHTSENPQYGISVPPGPKAEFRFGKAENLPCTISCGAHPWESAVVLIKDHPYVSVSDSDGTFRIPKLPAGRWRLRLWHERFGYLRRVTINGKKRNLEKGTLAVTIRDKQTLDLGIIEIAPGDYPE